MSKTTNAHYSVTLDHLFCQSERGNILLSHDEEPWMNAWIRLKDNIWLEIAYRPCNYPALTVQTTCTEDADLAEHINKNFGGGLWMANKMNLEGVKVDEDGHVVGVDNMEIPSIESVETKEQGHDLAVQWQHWQSDQSLDLVELEEWHTFFEKVAEKFPELTDEFKENLIISN